METMKLPEYLLSSMRRTKYDQERGKFSDCVGLSGNTETPYSNKIVAVSGVVYAQVLSAVMTFHECEVLAIR